MPRRSIFTVGGTVQSGGGYYLPRRVDDELLALCQKGDFGFVLTARQMGKTSLMVRTAERLAATGSRAVVIDLSQIGVQVTPEAWHLGLLTTIEDALELDTDLYDWWERHAHLGYGQRLTQFFQEVMLAEVEAPVVLFIDEIDTTLSLDFTDDFFAAIRYVYNACAGVPAFNRLTFVLIGVATPGDLISDPRRTPFNIGRRVEVDYFTLEEALPLVEGFTLPAAEAEQVLRWVLAWTAGHPYLTLRLCAVIAEQHQSRVTKDDVDRAVAVAFLREKSEEDSNLRFVHDMLTRRAHDPQAVLMTYRHILAGKRVPDDRQSATIIHLKLTGIVGRQDGRLIVRNPSYAAVFDHAWVKEQWPVHWLRSIPPVVLGLVASLFVAVILLGLFLLQTRQTRQAEEQRILEEENNRQVTTQFQVADSLRALAEAANVGLSNQVVISDGLRREADQVNVQLTEQIQVADSLREVEAAINAQLTDQVQVSDSLRTVAEVRLVEAVQARRETITLALASKALRQLKRGDAALGAMLARQAFLFSRHGEGEFLDQIYDALLQSLNALTGAGGPVVMDDYDADVRAVAYSPDGRWAAGADEAGTILLWGDGGTRRLALHGAGVRSLAFSPDGAFLASAGDDQTIRLWRHLKADPPEQEILGRLRGGVWTLAFSPDGTHLAAAGADRSVRIWNIRPEHLAAQICRAVQGRELNLEEWVLFVGEDFPYERDYTPCALTVNR